MPRNKSKAKKATQPAAPVTVNVTAAASKKKSRRSKAPKAFRARRWSDTVLNPAYEALQLPDFNSSPSVVAQSYVSTSATTFATTSWGNICAIQVSPRRGVTCIRGIAGVTGDTITWGAWAMFGNGGTIQTNMTTFRPTAAALEGQLANVSAMSASGQLYSIVGATNAIGTSSNTVSLLLQQPQISGCQTSSNNVAKAVMGLGSANSLDYIGSNLVNSDPDADVLTLLATNVPSTTPAATLQVFACINWEGITGDRNASILTTMPAPIDLEDFQRGLRTLARCQTFIVPDYDLGANSPFVMSRSQTMRVEALDIQSSGVPYTSTADASNAGGTSVTRQDVENYISMAERIGSGVRNIVTDAAVTGGVLLGGAAAPAVYEMAQRALTPHRR